MRRHASSIVIVCFLGAPQADALVKKLVPPMMAVVRLLVTEKFQPRIDDVLRRAPSAERLGDKWSPSHPAWPKAREAVAARVARLIGLYSSTKEIDRLLQQKLSEKFTVEKSSSLSSSLNGPVGPGVIYYEARNQFVLESMSATPNGPEIGSREWLAQLRELTARFDRQIGPDVPIVSGRESQDVMTFVRDPIGQDFDSLWMSVISKAIVTVEGALNLMLFDDRDAIDKDIAKAIASVK